MDESMGTLPGTRAWRTREDPFAEHWTEIEEMLRVMPELEAGTILEYLQQQYPGSYEDGQLRTLQRRLQLWRALNGTEKEVYYDQVHEPGQLLQLDWTHCDSLEVVVGGVLFAHKLCHCACTYSRWEWACVCHSEDFSSLRMTLQEALFELGGVPHKLQVDRSSAATHQLRRGEPAREFNAAFKSLLRHFGLRDRMITTGKPNENGTIESLHGHFRRRLNQALLLRGSRRFVDRNEYVVFINAQLGKANANRATRVAEEQRHLSVLPPSRYALYETGSPRVGSTGTLRIKKKTYSVPSRLIGQRLQSRLHPDRIELFLHGKLVHSMDRVYADLSGLRWQHLVPGLTLKPGAFARYRYRDTMFPHGAYRELCEALHEQLGQYGGDRAYLHILNAAALVEPTVALAAVEQLLAVPAKMHVEGFHAAAGITAQPPSPPPFVPDLSAYDELLEEMNNGQQ
jgi:transposase InsO family protein